MRHLEDEDFERFASILQGQQEQTEHRILHGIIERLDIIMSTLADLVTEDAALQTEIDTIVALVTQDNTLIQQLQATIGSGNLTAEQQAQVDSIAQQMTAQNAQIVAALTPVAPGTGTTGDGTGTTTGTGDGTTPTA